MKNIRPLTRTQQQREIRVSTSNYNNYKFYGCLAGLSDICLILNCPNLPQEIKSFTQGNLDNLTYDFVGTSVLGFAALGLIGLGFYEKNNASRLRNQHPFFWE